MSGGKHVYTDAVCSVSVMLFTIMYTLTNHILVLAVLRCEVPMVSASVHNNIELFLVVPLTTEIRLDLAISTGLRQIFMIFISVLCVST